MISPQLEDAMIMVHSNDADATESKFGKTDANGTAAKSLPYGTYTYRVIADYYQTAEGHFTLSDKNGVYQENVILRPNFSEMTFNTDADADIYIDNEKKGTGTWSGRLEAGEYMVESRKANHNATSQAVKVEANNNKTITLKSPTPIMGTLSVTSSPLGATIKIDGKEYGITPKNIDMVIGSHKVELSKQNHLTAVQTVEVQEGQTTDVTSTLSSTGNVTISSRPAGATLYINGKNVGTTPYTSEMTSGEYDIRLTCPEYKEVNKRVTINIEKPEMKFTLPAEYLKKTGVYVDAGAGVGTSGCDIRLKGGAYINNINIEAGFSYGFTKEDRLWQNNGNSSDQYAMAPITIALKAGYGIALGTRCRLTPQIGAGMLMLRNTAGTGNNLNDNVALINVGVRTEVAVARHVGVSITPEGVFAPKKSQLCDLSDKINKWHTGANIQIGVFATF